MEKETRKCSVVLLNSTTYEGIVAECKQTKLLQSKHKYKKIRLIKGSDEYFDLKELYVTSNEKIRKGDWYIHNQKPNGLRVSNSNAIPMDAIKIVISTDSSLGLPHPTEDFIETYVKAYNNDHPITKVLVEYEFGRLNTVANAGGISEGYKPKVNSYNEITIYPVQKVDYDKEEVIALLKKFCAKYTDLYASTFNNWIGRNL